MVHQSNFARSQTVRVCGRILHVPVIQLGRPQIQKDRGGARADSEQATHQESTGSRSQPDTVGTGGGDVTLQQHEGTAEGARAPGRSRVRAGEQRGGLLRQRGAAGQYDATAHRYE